MTGTRPDCAGCCVPQASLPAQIRPRAGPQAVLAAAPVPNGKPFDLIDLTDAQTLAIRMDDFCLIAVFDDSCAVLSALRRMIERTEGPLNTIQIREVAAEFACCNMHLTNRPRFWTRVSDEQEPRVYIGGDHDQSPIFKKMDLTLRGAFMERVIGDALKRIKINGKTDEESARDLHEGKLTFLFDDNGAFIKDGPQPILPNP